MIDICPSANAICEVLAKEIDSLSIEVLLCRNVVNYTKYLPSGAFICMEFEVMYHNGELLVRDKVNLKSCFMFVFVETHHLKNIVDYINLF